MMTRDGQPSPRQTKMMARVFVISTILGALVVFVNVTMRSYGIRMQQAELKSKQSLEPAANPSLQPAPAAEATAVP
jgi:hypothetical protein